MNDQELNKRLAELLGWTDLSILRNPGGKYVVFGTTPDDGKNHPNSYIVNPPNCSGCELPNYCSDLNAVHEILLVITDKQFRRYDQWMRTMRAQGEFKRIPAAKQHVKALIKTLEEQ